MPAREGNFFSSGAVSQIPQMAEFKDRLREAREALGLSKIEMSRRLDMSDRGYRKLEKGETHDPSADTLKKLKELTGKPAEWFLGDSELIKPGPRARAPQPAPGGPRSAREAVLDESHHLGFLMQWAGYTATETRLKVADRMDAKFTQFSTVTPALASLFLEGIRSEIAPDSPPKTKRNRGTGQ